MDPASPPRLPPVHRVLDWPAVAALAEAHGRPLVVDAVRAVLDACRRGEEPDTDTAILEAVSRRITSLVAPGQKTVFNLTGTVLHTNLGRAPLPPEAIEAMTRIAAGASNLEYDLATGKRGERDSHVTGWLQRLTGAEAATVVNNNAAAVLLTLNSLAARKEVIVSRGELIEIGGAFRLPDIMARAGCRLREVGTTNRTHLRDYAEAIGPRTALILKAHTSNYRIEGFTAEVDERTLAGLAAKHGLPFVVDLGSGTLTDLTRLGLPAEPTPTETLSRGADLVTFSGDKLLGGPQAGMVVGRTDLIERLRRNPMKRAMRCDKLTLAALEAVLRLYADPERVCQRIPALRLLTRSREQIAAMAARCRQPLQQWAGTEWDVDMVDVDSQIGSGSLPVDLLPSKALRLRRQGGGRTGGQALNRLAARLRALPMPVVGRIADDTLLLDLRCLEDPAPLLAQLNNSG
ncbi:MAG: L-seryl-tRNA(Sec) selenium transferase [Ectothiorhodospiraceae bacterium]|nr:L-seryl-tRNA(Sec) selenium transferase [Ectothiorhodospiraceae bacterium]